MPLMGSLILSICSGVDPQYTAACKASLETGSKQYGIYDKVNNGEKVAGRIITNDARDNFGNTAITAAGSLFFIGQSIQKKEVNFNIPTFGLCDLASSHIGIGSYMIRVGWRY